MIDDTTNSFLILIQQRFPLKVPQWNSDASRTLVSCVNPAKNFCNCTRIQIPTPLEMAVSPETLAKLDVEAKRVEVIAMTKWTWDMVLTVDSSEWLDHYTSLTGEGTPRCIILQPLGCIGDRVKAIELGIALSNYWQRPLRVVWVSDNLCTTRLENVLHHFEDHFEVVHTFMPWEADNSVFELFDFVINISGSLPMKPLPNKHTMIRVSDSLGLAHLNDALPEHLQGNISVPPMFSPCSNYPALTLQLQGDLGLQLESLSSVWAISILHNRRIVLTHHNSSILLNKIVEVPFEIANIDMGFENHPVLEDMFQQIESSELGQLLPQSRHISLTYLGIVDNQVVDRGSFQRVTRSILLTPAAAKQYGALELLGHNYSIYIGDSCNWPSTHEALQRKLAELEIDPGSSMLAIVELEELCNELPSSYTCVSTCDAQEGPSSSIFRYAAAIFNMADSKRIFFNKWSNVVEWASIRQGGAIHELICS
jgi:hypothetical protein